MVEAAKTSVTRWLAYAVGLGAALAFSAFLMAVAVHAPSGWWLGWLTLLPLFLCIRVLRPVAAAVAGTFWGVSFFAFSLAGGHTMITPTLGSLVLLGVIPGAYAGLGSLVTRRVGFSPLLLGIGWVGVEFALHPLALPHGLLAGTQGDGLFVRVIGNLAGYVLVAFLVAYVTASLLSVLSDVYVGVTSLRFAPRSSTAPVAVANPESRLCLLDYISPSRPRAPPLC